MPNCEVCSDLEYPKDISSQGLAAYRTVYADTNDLFESSMQGCPSCSLLQNAILAFVPDLERSDTVLIQICLQEYTYHEKSGLVYYKPSPMPFITVTDQVARKSLAKIDLFKEAYSPSAWQSIPIAQHTDCNTSSSNSFLSIRRWLAHCRWHHRCYSGNGFGAPPVLPHRVIDVGTTQQPHVQLHVSSADERAPYLCLSHCWGKLQIIRTLTSNINEFEKDIPRALLSNTFNDAIEATRRLGYRYIWIDSLCIVQDSAQDWRRESSRMSDYYGSAELTLAATKSNDGNGGLFGTSREYPLQGKGPPGGIYHIYARDHVRHFGYPVSSIRKYPHLKSMDLLADFPLLSRGWVYQERILSPRMVHFGQDELVWECLASRKCQCHGIRPDQDGQWSMDNAALDLPKLAMYKSRLGAGPDMIANIWRFMVMRFTELDLTYGTDKLPAMQGCATMHLASLNGSQVKQEAARNHTGEQIYIAGLWRGSILDDLLWHSERILPRPDVWRAPSFSWASIDGAAVYPLRLATLAEEQYQASVAMCKVEEVLAKPVASSLGPVSAGSLRLSGVLVQGSLRYSASGLLPGDECDPEAVSNESYATGDPYSISVRDVDFRFSADYALNIPGPHRVGPGSSIYAFRIIQRMQDDDGYSSNGKDFSLILRLANEAEQTYERIGLLDITTHEMIQLAERYMYRGGTPQSSVSIV